ncbi:MAG TPA: phospholipase [Myxococcaceae bacterium]|nr:phospholipase [Myxococcaceae bacterium]
MRRAQLKAGGLEAWVIEPDDTAAPPDLNVVLAHGYGAPADDLVGLAPELAAENGELGRRVRWIFPGAPLSLEEMGVLTGSAWWHLDIEALLSGRDWNRYVEETPEGLEKARRMLRVLLEEVIARTGVPISRTVLGGFSQGAMLATDLALRLEEPPAGLVILSGSLIARAAWAERVAHRAAMPVFMSHGRLDPLLPFDVAEQLRQLFVDAGAVVTHVPFEGQHTLSFEVLEGLAGWLGDRLRAVQSSRG